MANSADPDQLACKGRAYPGSAGQGLRSCSGPYPQPTLKDSALSALIIDSV